MQQSHVENELEWILLHSHICPDGREDKSAVSKMKEIRLIKPASKVAGLYFATLRLRNVQNKPELYNNVYVGVQWKSFIATWIL